MKKIIRLISISCILIFAFVGCSSNSDKIFTIKNEQYIFNFRDNTITNESNKDIIKFEINGGKYEIIYPDNSRYYRTLDSMGSSGGWSDDYNESKYVDGDILMDIIIEEDSKSSVPKCLWFTILAIVIGLWNILSPYSSWYLSHGWHYKEAEPSDVALGLIRFSGIIAIAMGIAALFF